MPIFGICTDQPVADDLFEYSPCPLSCGSQLTYHGGGWTDFSYTADAPPNVTGFLFSFVGEQLGDCDNLHATALISDGQTAWSLNNVHGICGQSWINPSGSFSQVLFKFSCQNLIENCGIYYSGTWLRSDGSVESIESKERVSVKRSSGLSNIDPPPTFPNIGYLGMSYNAVTGNPQSFVQQGGDPGFGKKQNVFVFTYLTNQLTDDKRYTIPDKIVGIQDVACNFDSKTSTVSGETSYIESMKASISEDVSGGYSCFTGRFSASLDYHLVSKEVYGQNNTLFISRAVCVAYSASIQVFNMPLFTDNFIQGVKFLHDNNASTDVCLKFVDTFGTHYTSSVLMGAEFGFVSSFDSATYTNLLSQSFDFNMGAQMDLKIFASAVNGSAQHEIEVGRTFQSLRSQSQQHSLGSLPSLDGKIESWARTSADSPYPMSYTLAPLAALLTTQNFPNLSNIDTVNQKLVAFLQTYCSVVPGAKCTPSPDASPIQMSMVFNSGGPGQYVTNTCPQNTISTSVGFERATHVGGDGSIVYANDKSGVCFDSSQGISCYSLCVSGIETKTVWSPVTEGHASTHCPSGYSVVDCGFYDMSFGSYEHFSHSYPDSSSSCASYDFFGHQGIATCVPTSMLPGYTIVSQFGSVSDTQAKCPSGTRVLGCGHLPAPNQKQENFWSVRPMMEINGCQAFNYFGVTVYAVCAAI